MQSFTVRQAGYRKLIIWQKGKEFLIFVYKVTGNFPKNEEYGLKSQLRRAALSFLLNIVEGQRRSSNKEFLRFLDISDASLAETEACLELALYLGFLSQKDYEQTESKRQELAIMLVSLIKSVRNQS